MKIVYLTPSLYIPGGVERVLTTKANWLAENTSHEICIVLTDGQGREPFYPLSPKIKVINLNIGFEEMWTMPFHKKLLFYLSKQRLYKKRLTKLLMEMKPDITDSLLRREINFLCDIKDGSRKIGEMHINRKNYRNFEDDDANPLKKLFARMWMWQLLRKLKKLDRFIVLSDEDRLNWPELTQCCVIPNPIGHENGNTSQIASNVAIAVGRYVHEKGFDLLLESWAIVHKKHPEWVLKIYGGGDRSQYEEQARRLGLGNSCQLNGCTKQIDEKYCESSLFILSSRFEGFGMVLVEAMQCGLPCVSFACPYGPRAIIEDGKNGLLVENGNTAMLAEKIIWAIEHPSEMKEMASNAIERSKDFEADRIMRKWVGLFDEIRQEHSGNQDA